MHFLTPLALTISALLILATDAVAQTRPPKSERFNSLAIESTEQLAKHLSPTAQEAVRELILSRKCAQGEMKLFQHRKPSSRTLIVTIPCDPPLGSTSVGGRYFEYPLTIAIKGDAVSEVDLPSHGFMYDTGRLKFITDRNSNDMPEFWLHGDVCESSPEEPGRNCQGWTVIEFKNGSLYPWKKPRDKSAR